MAFSPCEGCMDTAQARFASRRRRPIRDTGPLLGRRLCKRRRQSPLLRTRWPSVFWPRGCRRWLARGCFGRLGRRDGQLDTLQILRGQLLLLRGWEQVRTPDWHFAGAEAGAVEGPVLVDDAGGRELLSRDVHLGGRGCVDETCRRPLSILDQLEDATVCPIDIPVLDAEPFEEVGHGGLADDTFSVECSNVLRVEVWWAFGIDGGQYKLWEDLGIFSAHLLQHWLCQLYPKQLLEQFNLALRGHQGPFIARGWQHSSLGVILQALGLEQVGDMLSNSRVVAAILVNDLEICGMACLGKCLGHVAKTTWGHHWKHWMLLCCAPW